MKVVSFQRKPQKGAYSIERLFEDIYAEMPRDIQIKICVNKYPSHGIWRRIYDMIRAIKYQGDVNHISGDVHYLALLLRRSRTILTVHDCITLERLKGVRYWLFWFFWYWLPAKRSAVITVISESTKKELQKHLRSEQYSIEVVPNCVSSEFQPAAKKFNNRKPRILQIGTKKNKNIERVAEAIEGIICKLIIIGKLTQEQLSVLHKHNIDFENHFGISREALLDQYQQTDLVMFASLYEGFGLPILEAQAVGRPIITSNMYSMPEVGGAGASYVDPYNVLEIRSAVKQLIDDKDYCQRLIEQGYQNVKRFSAEAVARQYAALYRRLYNTLDLE